MIRAQVTVDRDRASVRMAYDAAVVAAVKAAVPQWGRSYDPRSKTWLIDAAYVTSVIKLLRSRYGAANVQVIGQDREPGRADWAAQLFERLPQRLREPAYKALIRVVHPDLNGDGRVCQELNDTYHHTGKAS